MPNDGDLFNLMLDWLSSTQWLKPILVDHPKEIYGQ
jgi:hypothetical protein